MEDTQKDTLIFCQHTPKYEPAIKGLKNGNKMSSYDPYMPSVIEAITNVMAFSNRERLEVIEITISSDQYHRLVKELPTITEYGSDEQSFFYLNTPHGRVTIYDAK